MLQQEKLYLESKAELLKYLCKIAGNTKGESGAVWQHLFIEMKSDIDNRLEAYKEIPTIIAHVRERAIGSVIGGVGKISVTRLEEYNINK